MNIPSSRSFTRREILDLAGRAAIAGTVLPWRGMAGQARPQTFDTVVTSDQSFGAVVGDASAVSAGEKFLKSGGNAIDAAVATAFAASITSPGRCGIAGYGGYAMIALAGGKKITTIDFNSEAPAAARPDMFPVDEKGQVKGALNTYGWLASGVPGTIAGLEMALARYGTRPLRDILEPAIQFCDEGVHVVQAPDYDDPTRNDPRPDADMDAKLPREKQRNLALGKLLKTIAARNTAESFYRGDIAAVIAEAFRRGGGLVNKEDLAAYRAHEVEPYAYDWNGMRLHTAPVTASGLLMLEAFSILKAVGWQKFSHPQRLHAKLEAFRIAWADRLSHYGDPKFVKVPVERLLSPAYAAEAAARVAAAVKAGKPVALNVAPTRADGTIHISAADRQGNLAAITLTCGGRFGARVHVEEYGMVLGHGMARFHPLPGHPNSVGSRKRPVNNMSPTIVTRGGIPVLAIGGSGGMRIPNSVGEVLLNFVGAGSTFEQAMTAPRLHTDGSMEIALQKDIPAADREFLHRMGYRAAPNVPSSAFVSAVLFDPATGQARGNANRGV